MAFGKPTKVSMKRAAKKKVPVAEPVAEDECPPSPPPVATDPPGLTAGHAAGLAALPSPGKLLLDMYQNDVKDALGMYQEAKRVLLKVEAKTNANAEAVPKLMVGIE